MSQICVCVCVCSQYPGYLGAIFTGFLKNSLPFAGSWAGQILTALAWLQVSMLVGYSRAAAMRAMHKGLHRAYAKSPHDIQATIKCVYQMSYSLPCPRQQAALGVLLWLKHHAYWEGGEYSSWRLTGQCSMAGITGV